MDQNPVILLVEDDSKMRHFLRSLLERNDYRVIEAPTGQAGIEMTDEHTPDLVLLDVGLPDIDGREVVGRLREWTNTPILMVSGRDTEESKVALLDAGANDYLTKPFGAKELLARVRVGLRHAEQLADGEQKGEFNSGQLRVDRVTRRVMMDGEEVDLTPTEYSLLLTLVRNVDRVVTHREILEEVWGPDCVGRDHYVRVYMAHLRRKLEVDPSHPEYIVTETGVGYRLRKLEPAEGAG